MGFSQRMTGAVGKLIRGEARLPAATPQWKMEPSPQALFHKEWLRRRVQGLEGCRSRRAGQGFSLAVPFDRNAPFPLETLFCLCRLQTIGSKPYVVFTFDQQERPLIS